MAFTILLRMVILQSPPITYCSIVSQTQNCPRGLKRSDVDNEVFNFLGNFCPLIPLLKDFTKDIVKELCDRFQ